MIQVNFDQLLEAGCHFGHLKRKWNPNMAPYIFMERNGIHIIDLYKTIAKMDEAANALTQMAKSGRKILFVGTKKQAKDIIAETAKSVGMPYVVERWPGGMLTNFATIRKAVKKMASLEKMTNDVQYASISKRERLQIEREKEKLKKNLGSISDLVKLPGAIFIVDISKEHIAVAEAHKLNIPTFGIVDTNSDPKKVDFPIPANDDAAKSIGVILSNMANAIAAGLNERRMDKEAAEAEEREEELARQQSKTVEELEEQLDAEGDKKRKRTTIKAGAKTVKLKVEDEVIEPIANESTEEK